MNQPTALSHQVFFTDVTDEVRRHRVGFYILGGVFLLLGIAALAFPFFATLAVEALVGWIFVISGIVSAVQALRAAKWKGFLWSLLGGLLSLGVGAVLLLYPMTGIISLTLLLAAFFFAGGLLRVLLAWRLRPLDHWGLLLVSGLLAVALAILILVQWPQAAAWVIGLFVGIDLIFTGSTTLMLAAAAHAPGAA